MAYNSCCFQIHDFNCFRSCILPCSRLLPIPARTTSWSQYLIACYDNFIFKDLGRASPKDSDDSSFSSQSLNNQKDWQGVTPAKSDTRLFKKAIWSSLEGRILMLKPQSSFKIFIFPCFKMFRFSVSLCFNE